MDCPEEIDRIAKQMQQAGIEDCVYLRMQTAIPQIDRDVFTDMADLDVLNDIAQRYAEMDTDEKMHYKAALTLAYPLTLSECRNIIDALPGYGWQKDWDSLGDIEHLLLIYIRMARQGEVALRQRNKDVARRVGFSAADARATA
ncbi:MAG: hypothetical protein LBD02_05670 [Christensenellaceae bacterium]|nr:hypothetical protein [Christensenellaceae bacterium]